MGFCYKVEAQFNLHNKIMIILKHKYSWRKMT